MCPLEKTNRLWPLAFQVGVHGASFIKGVEVFQPYTVRKSDINQGLLSGQVACAVKGQGTVTSYHQGKAEIAVYIRDVKYVQK